ncbi:MAG: histidine ammonia-lyase [Calditrichaeota bacterium]|nr:MAG: histidine ammonia-lyase [Calditrichota bacterium]
MLKNNEHKTIFLDGEHLTLQDLVKVARDYSMRIQLSSGVKENMEKSRRWVEEVQQSGEPVVYGVNTGFGSLAVVPIDKGRTRELQRNLIMSHAAGTGEPLPIEVVRAAMLLRANTLAKGFSGVRPRVVETILEMLEKRVTPWIPAQGSLGASGDLAPLSHMALIMMDNDLPEEFTGKAYWFDPTENHWVLLSGAEAMKKAGVPRIQLEAKEGLALNNGTQISTALLALSCYDAQKLVKMADIAMTMSLEALQGISTAFKAELHQVRPHPGQVKTARNIRRLMEGSQLVDRDPTRVQDAYSLRCHPQVLAGVRDTLHYIETVLEVEMNATTDNPIIFPELPDANKAFSGGNFHAQPIAFAADFLSIVLCEVGNISERRIFRLSDHHLNNGLPSFLIHNPGLHNGLMIAQYTAASLVSENKALAHPASVDSIPSSENQEDHVSMAPVAGRKARQILENVQKILAIELLYAAQALDLRLQRLSDIPVESPSAVFGKGTAAAYQCIRSYIPYLEEDRPLYQDIEKAVELVRTGTVLQAVEAAVGSLE